jgi:hypothetical protein
VNKNLEALLTLLPSVDISDRIVAGEGVRLPALDKVGIAVLGAETGARNAKALSPDANGAFCAENIMRSKKKRETDLPSAQPR